MYIFSVQLWTMASTLAEKFVIVTILEDRIDGKNVTLSPSIKRRFNKILVKYWIILKTVCTGAVTNSAICDDGILYTEYHTDNNA